MPCVSSSAASYVSLARLGSRIIRAMQSSVARVETAESVAKRSRRSGRRGDRIHRKASASVCCDSASSGTRGRGKGGSTRAP